MAQASAPAGRPPVSDDPASALPVVRVEVRAGKAKPTVYEVGDGGFLVGGVPGCDLRLPGPNLPPVLCLIARQPRGASLRKLAPVQPITVNGRAVSSTYLADGDRVALGAVELVVSVTPGAAQAAAVDVDERIKEIDAYERELRERRGKLEEEQALWERRREEIDSEFRRKGDAAGEVTQRLRQAERDLAAARADLEEREAVWAQSREELARQRQETDQFAGQAQEQLQEAAGLRKQLTEIREKLYDRYRQRRDRLAAKHKALRHAARKLAERKRVFDEEEARAAAGREELALKQAEADARAEQLERERSLLDDQHKVISGRQQELQRELAERLRECEEREQKITEERAALEKGQKQHQADLVRLDRIQAKQEQKLKQLQLHALEVDHRFEQLQRDTRELEEQAVQLDEWHNRLAAETEQLAEQKKQHEAAAGQLDQRAAALEGQQGMLAALRTRLERMREELRRQEQSLSDQRVLQEAGEADLRDRLQEAQRLRADLENDKELLIQDRRTFEERGAAMQAAVMQLRKAQDGLDGREQEVRQRQEEQDATAGEQAEQAALLVARAAQLEELHGRLAKDKQTLRDREAAQSKAEQTLVALQEQLRRRAEELNERQHILGEQEQKLREEKGRLELQTGAANEQQREVAGKLDALRQELTKRAEELDALGQDLARREDAHRAEADRLADADLSLNGQRQALAAERIGWEVDRQAAKESDDRTREEFEAARGEALELIRQLPDLETRAAVGFDRLLRAREQLREHLAEVHAYARQSRDDLEAARKHVQDEVERVRQEELALHVARDEHRLAVAAFRQQLIEWQGHVGEMRQTIRHDETRLDRRRAAVDEQAQRIAADSARLLQQAEQLQEKEREVLERRMEMGRHLADMREWYRRKLRDLAGLGAVDGEGDPNDPEAVVVPMPAPADAAPRPAADGADPGRDILSLTGEIDPGDRQLGDLLQSLELVDGDTLTALLLEARRQRRSLRQLLLAGNYLTLYQMALIEAGNLDGLVLGPARVIDRLQAAPREAVFRVFDPRHNREAVLRWLAETEMTDAVHPDEFRQRFTAAAAVRHAHVAATYEVLEIAGRPAALQEWLVGLPSPDWPATAAAPGVWFRLLTQAALGLQAVHEAGLVHGALRPASFVCTREGVLKLCGLGEPGWLAAPPEDGGDGSPAADLRALGRIAAAWAAAPPRKNAKSKPPPDALQAVLRRLNSDGDDAYPGAAALLEDLARVGDQAPANPAAWERFVRDVKEHSADAAWRRTA